MFFQGYLPTLVFFVDFLLNCGVSLLNKQTNTVQMITGPTEAKKRAELTSCVEGGAGTLEGVMCRMWGEGDQQSFSNTTVLYSS